ncbi:MAG: hypothetical protein KDB01_11175 [Planctomycetaceae bacterium]|nr:hypothetical protein [Planctomycetaceae bacterium]
MSHGDLISEIRGRYQQESDVLNERQRRLWAAAEAMNLGRGGIAAVSKALRISPNTIKKGIREISAAAAAPATDPVQADDYRIRKAGGGRKIAQKLPDPRKKSQ